jgi:hypothetical protein
MRHLSEMTVRSSELSQRNARNGIPKPWGVSGTNPLKFPKNNAG